MGEKTHRDTMANLTMERGACAAPFLQRSQFDSSVGCKNTAIENGRTLLIHLADLPGRFCAPVPTAEGTVDCCLPCPITDWVYSDG